MCSCVCEMHVRPRESHGAYVPVPSRGLERQAGTHTHRSVHARTLRAKGGPLNGIITDDRNKQSGSIILCSITAKILPKNLLLTYFKKKKS